ncbi:hypothetical protein [Shinella sp.]|uniref:hypothetical protein n=1 Tax=Shinella sp. TaxID=1870904 RepID=UPI00299FBD94|nr:hypothetical protein [Shinella sp.]MDX3972747.1 hypothetical protein [Shinella sp.]
MTTLALDARRAPFHFPDEKRHGRIFLPHRAKKAILCRHESVTDLGLIVAGFGATGLRGEFYTFWRKAF